MRSRLVTAAVLMGSLLAVPAFAQAVPENDPVGWDALVTVRKDNVGADFVTVGMRVPGYPPELLKSQLEGLGVRLGGQARGVSVTRTQLRPNEAQSTLVQGSCSVDGLIDPNGVRLAVAPIAQAFAGAPAPYTVRRMTISFDGVRPGPQTVARHGTGASSDLSFVGRVVGSSVEYDVVLRSQDVDRLVVNEKGMPAKTPTSPRKGPDPMLVGTIVVAVIAAGALVYCLLLMLGRKPAR
jgi:hypothetical protein